MTTLREAGAVRRESASPPPRRGAAMILMIFMFVAMTAFAFLSFNITLMERHHAAGQVAADLASRAAVDELSRTTDTAALEAVARDIAQANWNLVGEASGANVQVQVAFGSTQVNQGRVAFLRDQLPFNAVQVEVDRDVNRVGFASQRSDTYLVQRDATSAIIERDLCLVVDRSGSMNFDLDTGTWMYDTSYHPYNAVYNSDYRRWSYEWWYFWPHPERSRWSSMMPAIYALVDELGKTGQQEQFSIVSYSSASSRTAIWNHSAQVEFISISDASVESPMVSQAHYLTAVAAFDNKYKHQQPVAGATNISAGIDAAVASLTGVGSRSYAFKTMILMTDGQFNTGREPWLAAEDAAAAGVEIHTVTFSDQANQNDMIRTAQAANGRHFHAPDGAALAEIFREIASLPVAAIIE